MNLQVVAGTVGLALVATANVGLWTLRVALAAAGRRTVAAGVSGVEAVLFVLAFGTVISSLDDPVRIGAYAIGVAAGTSMGLRLEASLSGGQSLVRVITAGPAHSAVAAVRSRGWTLTGVDGHASEGTAAVLLVVVDDAALKDLERDLDDTLPGSLRTVERLRSVSPTPSPRSPRSRPRVRPRPARRGPSWRRRGAAARSPAPRGVR
jgi:uncharacterized protein YebE (UPF0316 family)